jgi:hypothetical protein
VGVVLFQDLRLWMARGEWTLIGRALVGSETWVENDK